MTRLQSLIAAEQTRLWRPLALACLAAATVTAASVLLLGLSGWFISAAALAGLAGPAAANAFNYMLPAVGIRLFAILRTGGRYAERVFGHDAALRALADLRPALFAAILAGDYIAQGFRNKDVRLALRYKATSEVERRRQSAAMGRILRRLRVRGLIAKVPRTRRWRVTDEGRRILGDLLQAYRCYNRQAA